MVMIANVYLNACISIFGTIIAPRIEAKNVTTDKINSNLLSFGKWSVFRNAATELIDMPVAMNAPVVAPCAGVMPDMSQYGAMTNPPPPPAMPLKILEMNATKNVAI